MGGQRLKGAASPYLAMHAGDPVEWRPWGDDAFKTARAEDKLVFLSVGYASCHWCHVMQRESFRDEETAKLLAERCVPVKVDRETRPEVDALYMDYVIASSGSGGWPMSVFLTPEKLPVFGGTYFPRKAPGDYPSFAEVVTAVTDSWREDPERTEVAASKSEEFLRQQSEPMDPHPMSRDELYTAVETILLQVDEANGGFGKEPKFPQFSVIGFLRAFARWVEPDPELLFQAGRALEAILRGGIYDQVAGGVFRYATDAGWLVPHFEKMLYDNAQLLSAIAEAKGHLDDVELSHAARQTAEFLFSALAAPDGLLYSSTDAEAGGVEGAAYMWHYQEISSALTEEELQLARDALGVTEEGNRHSRTILTRPEGRAVRPDEVDAVLRKLLEARTSKPQPAATKNVIVSWNASAARGLMDAGAAFEDAEMLGRGVALLDALLAKAVSGDEVVHVIGDTDVEHVRLLEDYAHLAAACLTATEKAGRDDLVETAERLHDAALARFMRDGALYMTAADTDLPARPREHQDSPVLSGASVTIENAARLFEATGNERHRDTARTALERVWGVIDFAPMQLAHALAAGCRLTSAQG